RAPGHGVAPEAHAVPRRRPHRGHRRGPEALADVRHEVAGAVLRRGRRAVPAGRFVPDQPDLALRPLPRPAGELAGPARLVHGLAGGRPPAVPAVGDPGLRLRDPQPVLPGRVPRWHHVPRPLYMAIPGGLGDPRPGRPPSPRPAPGPPLPHVGRGGHAVVLCRAVLRRLQRPRGQVAQGARGRRDRRLPGGGDRRAGRRAPRDPPAASGPGPQRGGPLLGDAPPGAAPGLPPGRAVRLTSALPAQPCAAGKASEKATRKTPRMTTRANSSQTTAGTRFMPFSTAAGPPVPAQRRERPSD